MEAEVAGETLEPAGFVNTVWPKARKDCGVKLDCAGSAELTDLSESISPESFVTLSMAFELNSACILVPVDGGFVEVHEHLFGFEIFLEAPRT